MCVVQYLSSTTRFCNVSYKYRLKHDNLNKYKVVLFISLNFIPDAIITNTCMPHSDNQLEV